MERCPDERRIHSPRRTSTFIELTGTNQRTEPKRQEKQAKMIEPRKNHLRNAQETRNEQIAKARQQRRHNKEEDHEHSMTGDGHIIELTITKDQLLATTSQLSTQHERKPES